MYSSFRFISLSVMSALVAVSCKKMCMNHDYEPSHYNFSYDYGKNARKNFRELLQRKYKTIDRLKLTSR